MGHADAWAACALSAFMPWHCVLDCMGMPRIMRPVPARACCACSYGFAYGIDIEDPNGFIGNWLFGLTDFGMLVGQAQWQGWWV